MVLVYTNGKERAIALAAMIGGITIGNTVVRRDKIEKYREEIEQSLVRNGGLVTFFRGDTYFVIYSSENPSELYKLSDYNSDYEKAENRPIPFIPSEFGYHVVDKELNRHLDIYRNYIDRALERTMGAAPSRDIVKLIVDASSDDAEGERASDNFFNVLDRPEFVTVPRNVVRVRPSVFLPIPVLAAFNAVEDSRDRENIRNAAIARKQMDWLISANAGTLLYQRTNKVLAIGRVECALLSLLFYREAEHRKENGCYDVYLKFEAVFEKSDVRPVTERFILPPAKIEGITLRSEAEAKDVIKKLPDTFYVEKSSAWHATGHRANSPYNSFTVQAEACKTIGMTAHEVVEDLKTLFIKGLITWPSNSESVPWRMKNLLTGSVVMLANLPEFRGKIRPNDIDTFNLWDQETTYEASMNHSGIFVTEINPSTVSLTERQWKLYLLIAERVVKVFTQNIAESNYVFRARNDDFLAIGNERIQYDSLHPSNDDIRRSSLHNLLSDRLEEGYELKVVEAYPVVKHDAEPLTEAGLIEFAIPLMENTYSNDMRYFSAPIENLIAWKLIERDENGLLSVTKRGEKEMRYISGTSLSDLSCIFDWDRRLQMVARGKRNDNPIKYDVEAYIEDLVDELNEKCDELAELESIDFDACKCPICGSQVDAVDGGGWRCLGANCTFKIPETAFGHTITWRDVWKVLSDGCSDRHSDFVSQKGNVYSARLEIRNGEIATTFLSPYRCPICGNRMQEWDKFVRCSNTECNFSINTMICEVHLTDEHIAAILNGQKTELINDFHNKKTGKHFAAKLYLEGRDIKFDFPPRGKK